MSYFVVETQANETSGVAIVNNYTAENLAEQKYHEILSAAAVSPVLKHGALLITDDLRIYKREIYDRSNPESQLEEQ